jgi:excisionase family DNA binding protein
MVTAVDAPAIKGPTALVDSHVDDLRLLSIGQFAERTATSPRSVREWARQGRLRTVKLGDRRLIPESELRRVVRRGL